MKRTMKAAVVREFGKPLEIEEVPIPQPSAGQVLIKVRACGVCGTDLHAASGNWPVKPNPPFIPGHEGVGNVAVVGPGVTHVSEGDRGGDQKTARLDADYGINFSQVRLRQLIDHRGETVRVGDQWREVPEHYSGLGKVRYVANQFFDFFGSHA